MYHSIFLFSFSAKPIRNPISQRYAGKEIMPDMDDMIKDKKQR